MQRNVVILTSSWCVFAGTGSECYIESNSAGGYTMLINTPTYNVVTREVTNPQEMADATKDVPITLRGDGVACKAIPMVMRLYTFLILLMPD